MADISNKISIKITADTNSAKSEINSLVKKLNSLKTTFGKNELKVKIDKSTMTNLEKLSNINAENLSRLAVGLKTLSTINKMPRIPDSVPEGLYKIGRVAHTISKSDIEKLSNLADAMQKLSGVKSISSAIAKSKKNNEPKEPKFEPSLMAGTESASFASLLGNMSTFQKLGLIGKAAFTGIGAAARGVGNAGIAVVKSAVGSLANKFDVLRKKASKAMTAIGRIAFYRSIRRAIQLVSQAFVEGTKNIYAYSSAAGTQLSTNLDSIFSNLMQMKNAIGSAVAPLINMLTPAINTVINAVTVLEDKLAQLFALMSGASTYSKAIATTYSFGDAIGSTGSAAGSAKKEMGKYTMGIDELNVISEDSGSGGSSSYDPTTAFTEAAVGFGQNLIDMFNSGDFSGIGTMLAEKINESISNINFEEIGTTVGETIQSAIEFANGFLTNLDTFSIGDGIAKFINNAIDNIDFETFGATWIEFWNKLIELASGFVKNLDWKGIGEAIADFLKGAFENANVSEAAEGVSALVKGALDLFVGLFEETDWQKLGATIIEKLGDLLAELDINGILSSAMELVGALIGGVAGLIAGAGSELWQEITDAFGDAGEWTWEGFCQGVVNALATVGSWIKTNIFDPFINGFKKAFGIASPSKEMDTQGGYIIDGLWQGIKNAWHSIPEYFQEKLDDIKDDIKERWENMKSDATEKWDEIKGDIGEKWDNISSSISDISESIRSTIEDKWDSIKSDASDKWNSIKSYISDRWDDIKSKASTVSEDVRSTVESKWSSIKSDASTKWANIKKEVSDKWDDIKEKTGTVTGTVGALVSSAWGTVSSNTSAQWTSIKTNFLNAWDSMKEGIKAPLNAIIGFVETLANSVVAMANNIIDAINDLCDVDIPDWVPKIGGKHFSLNIPKVSEVSIPRLENGGFTDADLFYANENGNPEMIGRIGNRTAVANNGQIIEGIANGVTLANGGVESLLETLISVVDGKNFNVSIDSNAIGVANEQYNRNRGLYVNRGAFANAY